MSLKLLLRYTVFQWVMFTFLKIWFFNYEILDNPGAQEVLFWVIVGIISAALIRRFGVINFLEVLFVFVFWTLLDLFLDLIITSIYTGVSIFSTLQYWAAYFIMGITMFMAHKKYHIQRRHELHAKAHAHQHPPHSENGHKH